ncbi:MAG: bifunctional diaminohydroxyphosphoribosylaminopyrimidine deaminase/5-amino-6-(5-phosphoribosylamino)uracil reductase RibD [Desulfuromonadaceae bacterium]|nr:bifunctional diaminohydroxyphosphoribosylaminopyrimidine deaminase/5-amino-6-(5-phosphoribosylamino)uracil reductase RibD [Desulfuromonadaceae bacterium]
MADSTQQQFMARAIKLAEIGLGRTAPNPPVGAVIVRDGQVVGEGFHPKAGEPHAEIFALREAAEKAAGADVYVTLEPCSHYGRTEPCADALVAAGVKRVFVGVQDPNPQVAGRGIEKLRQAGIEVAVGVQERQCRRLIAAFTRHITTGFPFTIYKTAMTLDGKTATTSGDSQWISGELSRQRVHQLRDRVEAIMVGIETLLADDPLLNTRLSDNRRRDPLRVVVDSRLRIPLSSRMLRQESSASTFIATTAADPQKISALQQLGAEVMIFPESAGGVSLPHLWQELGRRHVQRLLLEGGATLAGAALQAGLIDQMMVFVAPKMIGGSARYGIFNGEGCHKLINAVRLVELCSEQLGEDILITGDVEKCSQD